jgi:very-short-patch-repair endonuclease
VNRARKLRRNSTDAEARLWHILRDRGSGAKFRRQFPFGPYILDFYCLERRLVIEVDGSQHYEADGLAKDAERTALLEKSGLRMLRFTNLEVFMETDDVAESIRQAIESS